MSNTSIAQTLAGRLQRRLLGMRRLPLVFIASSAFGVAGFSQDSAPTAWQGKLPGHVLGANGSVGLAQSGVPDGYRQLTAFGKEVGHGDVGYTAPMAPTLAYSALGFGPDTVLPKDPRYLRSGDSGLWQRTKEAIHATIVLRTDSSGPLATWRFGSLYDASLSKEWWYPDRVEDMNVALEHGSSPVAFNLRLDLRSDVWSSVKDKILHRKP